MRLRFCFVSTIFCVLSFSALTSAQTASLNESTFRSRDEITDKNWQRHPRIVAVRKIVASVDGGLKSRRFKTSQRKFDCALGPEVRRIARDASGAVRWFEYYTVSEGAEHEYDYHLYFDQRGRLRFVLLDVSTGGYRAVQVRAYLDEGEKILKRDYKRFGGGFVGSPLGPEEPIEPVLMQDPAKTFASDAEADCHEIKAQSKRSVKKK